MTDTFREEFEIRIDQIITRALLNTSNNPESDPQKIYDAFPLHKLVITPVLDALFERIDSETKNIFFSKDGALGRCRKMLTSAEKIYTCNDCSLNISRSLCEECFIDSCHVKHNFSETSVEYDLFCHCGDQEAFGKSFPCGIHQIPKNSRRLPKHFVKRIGNIIRRFLKYLELLCGDDESLETQVNECLLTKDNLRKLNLKEDLSGIRFPDQNQMKNTNAHKWCVLIFQPDDESPECADSCLRFAKPPGVLTDLQSNFEMCGFLCVKYRDTKKNCQTFKVRIQRFIHESLPGSGLHCRIVKVHRLSFMKLSSTLTEWIYNTCLRKSELCDLMSEILFNETTLPQKFFFNRNLWNEIRFITTHRIFLSILFSQNRARNLSDFYLENFDQLYSEVLVNTDLMHHLLLLATQLSISTAQFTHLLENGFLCKILDFLSCNLKRFGFGKGKTISRIKPNIFVEKMDLFTAVSNHFLDILNLHNANIGNCLQVQSQLKITAIRLVKFCADFDDMEPFTAMDIYQDTAINDGRVFSYIHIFHRVFVPYVTMILKFDDIANLILREFVIVFKMDMEIITANVSTQRGIEKLITLPNIEKKRFSIFNMSKRLFFDIFTECVVKRKLSDELRKTIFEDNVLLMWISQTAITSLSFEMWVKARNLITLALIYHTPVMVHYLFMQDFNAIQILVSCISPEHFLKYLIFNVCPSIREKTSVSKPLASILSLQELDDIMVLQEVLILIYNALTEMRLVGDLKDPDSYFMERQVNHMVSCECKTKNVLKSKMYVDRSSFKSVIPDSRFIDIGTMMLHKACPQNPPQKDDAERAFIKYLNPGAPIYYLYTIPDTDYTFETLSRHYKDQVPYFLLPDVTDLREDFKGLNNFLFSETFFVFVMECFVRWYGKPELWKRDSLDLLLLILLILCLILRVSKYRDVCESDRERMFDFFGPHTKLENRSLLDIMMSERPNNQNPLVASMIDRFVSLSHLAKPSK